ncbi:carboxymuconolactone decarboxylase family protein [Natrialba sp. INN-245]|uniref:carboxymuconolactone decarboxylase family protein n=1 Tax=Natrialba sp. INN-245 TaxID=2690967 RepID=UPI00131247B6|nr:carboxymuconolactone decarboxylase family protein [Natrialba sp. INN-245]MWV41207.1 carboxymuconolactone decarboxylase family protein [Natrialba sp. INN-245]
MSRVPLIEPDSVDDPAIEEIFEWVTEMEGTVPNHFYLEMNFPEYMKHKLRSTAVLWEEGELSMPEIQHVGIAVSKANGCEYCTGAFCTILDYGLEAETKYVLEFLEAGTDVLDDARLEAIVDYALIANEEPTAVTDEDVERLRDVGLGDKGIVQLTHVVSDFASYNRINSALDTDYDYQEMWREANLTAMNPAADE